MNLWQPVVPKIVPKADLRVRRMRLGSTPKAHRSVVLLADRGHPCGKCGIRELRETMKGVEPR